MNSITFSKQQRHLIPKFIDLINQWNDANDDVNFNINVLLRPEEDLIIMDFGDNFEATGFTYVDQNHMVVPDQSNPIWLDIDPDAKYTVFRGLGQRNIEIDGMKLLDGMENNDENRK